MPSQKSKSNKITQSSSIKTTKLKKERLNNITTKKQVQYNTIQDVVKDLSTFSKSKKVNLYIVGGFIRDNLLDIPSKDIDLVVEGNGVKTANMIANTFKLKKPIIFKKFGTAQLKFDNIEVEIVGARKESYTLKSHKPIVSKGTLKDDLLRRDFTINTLAINLKDGKMTDITGRGLQDLENGIIKTPLNPDVTFTDDPSRMMRAVRFASKFDFTIEEETFNSIVKNANEINRVPIEKVRDEFNKILTSDNPRKGIELLKDSTLMKEIIPEYLGLSLIKHDRRFHRFDLEEHILITLQNSEKNLIDRLSALFHDFGKKRTMEKVGEKMTFYGHEEKLDEIEEILNRMKYPKNVIKKVLKIISLHMRAIFVYNDPTEKAIRKFIRDSGEELEHILNLLVADSFEIKGVSINDILTFKEEILNYPSKEEIKQIQYPLNAFEIAEIMGFPSPLDKEWSIEFAKQTQMLKDEILEKIVIGELKDKQDAIQYLKTIK